MKPKVDNKLNMSKISETMLLPKQYESVANSFNIKSASISDILGKSNNGGKRQKARKV